MLVLVLSVCVCVCVCVCEGVSGEAGGEMSVGSLVIARWRNHSWYPATVTGNKNGR